MVAMLIKAVELDCAIQEQPCSVLMPGQSNLLVGRRFTQNDFVFVK